MEFDSLVWARPPAEQQQAAWHAARIQQVNMQDMVRASCRTLVPIFIIVDPTHILLTQGYLLGSSQRSCFGAGWDTDRPDPVTAN